MISWLSGAVLELDPSGSVVLNVNGVGYEVFVSMQTLVGLKVGAQVSLQIHSYVREDQFTLFGFSDHKERTLFRSLNKVSGIGAKTALNLMSGMNAADLMQAIENSDDVAIARTPGIGKKTAQRLILELRGKLIAADTAVSTGGGLHHDVKSALVNLGYKPAQIDKVLKSVDSSLDFEAMFRAALKAL
ncbi:Holliday junction branch migration protein RuvA [Ghiorsea bivora]|uniref:Holliday junction branch migration protein RuvA n=1 Tax=Ghiorsea bivora TaxID=1485545 RepID=UPI0005708895|nr:Holliday junction branch migration protein RuvA [Ghiorsea bivora]